MPEGHDAEIANVERLWYESDVRSRQRRAAAVSGRRGIGWVVAALAGIITATAITVPDGGGGDPAPANATGVTLPAFETFNFNPDGHTPAASVDRLDPLATVPAERAISAAGRYATARGGLVSFATIDSDGHLRGHNVDRPYAAASVVKAMVLAAELWRLDETRTPIDSDTDFLLTAMITQSDNAATDVIYDRVGDAGLQAVAERAGMTGFEIAGYWGNAQITAADMARFFGDLDRMLPRSHREYGRRLLGSVVESQSWGIPEAAGSSWASRFKGGWLPDQALVHQAAELRERRGPREISLVVLTDEQPSFDYGIETVHGVAERLLPPIEVSQTPGSG